MPIYTLGNITDIEAFRSIVVKYYLSLVADAACAIGATRRVGNFGDLADASVISFNAGDIVRTVYGRGAFLDSAVRNMAIALTGCGVPVVFYVYKELFSRLQYSYYGAKKNITKSSRIYR